MNGEIQFDPNGKLRLFRFLPRGQTNRWVWLARSKSLISTNEAYQIAIQKAAALSVDLEALDRDYKRTFGQGQFYRYDRKKRRIRFDTPEFWLEWKDRHNPFSPAAVSIAVFGDIKQVGHIRVRDPKYLQRQPLRVNSNEAF